VGLLRVQRDFLVHGHDLAVDPHADEAVAADHIDDLHVLALAAHDDGREEVELLSFIQVRDRLHHLRRALALEHAAALGAVHFAHLGPQQAHVVVHFRHRAHGGARVSGGGLLVDRDRGGEALDAIDLRLLHLRDKLARVGAERFDIPALAFGEDGIEGKRRFAGTGDAGNHGELIAGDLHVDTLQVVHAGASDDDMVHRMRGE